MWQCGLVCWLIKCVSCLRESYISDMWLRFDSFSLQKSHRLNKVTQKKTVFSKSLRASRQISCTVDISHTSKGIFWQWKQITVYVHDLFLHCSTWCFIFFFPPHIVVFALLALQFRLLHFHLGWFIWQQLVYSYRPARHRPVLED